MKFQGCIWIFLPGVLTDDFLIGTGIGMVQDFSEKKVCSKNTLGATYHQSSCHLA